MSISCRGVYYWRRIASRVTPFKSFRSNVRGVLDEETGFNEQTDGTLAKSQVSFLDEDSCHSQQQNNDHLATSVLRSASSISGISRRHGISGTGQLSGGVTSDSSTVETTLSDGAARISGTSSIQPFPEPTSANLGASFDGEHEKRIGNDKTDCTYFETYLKLMYITCLSPFKPDGATGGMWDYNQGFRIAQLVLYWTITFLAITKAMTAAKLHIFVCIIDGGLENFTNMGFFIMNACTLVYFAYLLSFHQSKFSKLLLNSKQLRAFDGKNSKEHEDSGTCHTTKAALLGLVSLTMSVLRTTFQEGLNGWTAEKTILSYSVDFSIGFMTWTPEDVDNNSTILVILNEEYGTNFTTKTALCGLTFMAMTISNRVISCALGDLILLTALMLLRHISCLANGVGNPVLDIQPVCLELFEAENGQWAHYKKLKGAVDSTNDAMDGLLKYMHVDNITLFVYFALNVFDGDMTVFAIAFFLYNIIKTSCTYRVATKASEKNATFLKWMRRLIWKSRDKEFTAKSYAILHEIEKEPLGLGKGQFLIDESFMFRFLGTVGSVFVLQAQSRETSEG